MLKKAFSYSAISFQPEATHVWWLSLYFPILEQKLAYYAR